LAKMEERSAWSAVERRGGFMSQPPLTFNSFIALNIPTHVFVIIGRLWWSNGRVFSIQLNRMLLRWFWVKLTFTPTTWPLPTDPYQYWFELFSSLCTLFCFLNFHFWLIIPNIWFIIIEYHYESMNIIYLI
jgi:hypothetical protein